MKQKEADAYEKGKVDGKKELLEALKKTGQYGKKFDGSMSYFAQTPQKGWAIFIPDDPEGNKKEGG